MRFRRLTPVAARLREEDGMTIVEGVVAALIVVIGALATLQAFDAGARNTFRAEESQVVVNRLQAELEKISALPYTQVALSSMPTASAEANDPRSRVTASSFAVDRAGTDVSPLVVDGTNGHVHPGPTPFETGDLTGKLYRFVVWRNDPGCPDARCPGSQDLKQVTVAATIDEAAVSFERAYQEVQTEISDPNAVPVNPGNPTTGTGGCPTAGCVDVPSQFWITDTPCGHTTRQNPSSHPVHNTRSSGCSTDATSGSTAGPPDLMFTQAPSLDPCCVASNQPIYDYATDGAFAADSEGLTIRPQSDLLDPGCILSPVQHLTGGPRLLDFSTQSEPDPEQKLHKWVSPAIPEGDSLVLTGTGNLSLWTRTVNAETDLEGKICVWLFVRTDVQVLDALGAPVTVPADVPVVPLVVGATNRCTTTGATYWTYAIPSGDSECTQTSWPSQWTEIRMKMNFAALSLAPTDRLGLAIAVDRGGTESANGLQFQYDHPNFDSRLELTTETVLPF
jgi:Tfp pilus assembly protein PilE